MASQSFDECLVRLLQPSRELIERMQNQGIDLSKPREVTHLLLGDDVQVTQASKLFAERGFDILESAKGRLLLGDQVSISEEWVGQTIPAICSKAVQFGLTYDGWDVDVAATRKSGDHS